MYKKPSRQKFGTEFNSNEKTYKARIELFIVMFHNSTKKAFREGFNVIASNFDLTTFQRPPNSLSRVKSELERGKIGKIPALREGRNMLSERESPRNSILLPIESLNRIK